MKIAQPYICDECGVEKSAQSDWLLIDSPYADQDEPLVAVWPWSDEQAEIAGIAHVCSIDCSQKVSARSLAKAQARKTQERKNAASSEERIVEWPERES